MTWPPLAIAATIIAFCSGVNRTSRCPIADCCSEAVSGMSPSVEGATVIGIGGRRRADAERLGLRADLVFAELGGQLGEGGVARAGQRVAQRGRRARCRTAVPAKFSRCVAVSCSVISDAAVSWLSGVKPACSAAAVSINLNVEPGG